MTDDLDVVAVGIEDVRAVVGRVIALKRTVGPDRERRVAPPTRRRRAATLRALVWALHQHRPRPAGHRAAFEITISNALAERALGRANIAPTQSALAGVRGEDCGRDAVLARFGLAPAWAKLRGGPSLIDPGMTSSPVTGRGSGWRRRGLRAPSVADGYNEWQKPEDPKQPKQPFYDRLPDGEPSAFATAQGRRGAGHLLLDHHHRRQRRGARRA